MRGNANEIGHLSISRKPGSSFEIYLNGPNSADHEIIKVRFDGTNSNSGQARIQVSAARKFAILRDDAINRSEGS